MGKLSNIILLLLVVLMMGSCKKNDEDYAPPTNGHVPTGYFVESTWKVQENTISIPDAFSDFCMRHITKLYFGQQTCLVTAEGKVNNQTEKREYKGTYRVENVGNSSTYLYIDNLVHATDSCSYVLVFDEFNTNRSSISIVLDLRSGKKLPDGNYGSFRITK